MTETDVKEGLLCPICKIDFITITKLHSHFHEEHSDDVDITKFIRDVFDRAKNILKPNDVDKDIIHNLEIYNTFKEIGVRRSHFEKFKEIRNYRLEGFSAETNKLIIRLDKLLTHLPSDPNRRKIHEQSIVPWIDGEDVSRCPECTKSFHLARRQHHCRLCGCIMCHDCSCFLSIAKARNILSRTIEDKVDSEDSFNEEVFRTCRYCMNLLETRELMKASRNFNPLITQLYGQLRSFITELDKDADMYQEMSLSLNEGKSKYNLTDARNLWEKIMKLSEKISLMSAKIMNENPDTCSERELQLRKAVSNGVNGYIQSKILALPTLPSDELYKKLQDDRRRKVHKTIREERREDTTDTKTETVPKLPPRKLQENVSVNEGWIPDLESTYQNANPIIEQMNNIRSYIKQAREAYKFDEVASLEKNLQELKEEFLRQQSNLK